MKKSILERALDNNAKEQCAGLLQWIREQGYEWSMSGQWFLGGSTTTIEYFTDEQLANKYFEFINSK